MSRYIPLHPELVKFIKERIKKWKKWTLDLEYLKTKITCHLSNEEIYFFLVNAFPRNKFYFVGNRRLFIHK